MQLVDGSPVYSATDLVGFLACSHRLALERAALANLVTAPVRDDPTIDLIARRGYAHEQRYLEELRASGRRVVEIGRDGSAATGGYDLRAAAGETEAAMRDAADVIYQATFFDGRWRGHADFLLKVERSSALGSWSYEVADTKLARHVTGGAVIQICSYIEHVERIQRRLPEWLHVVLGGSERRTESLRVDDYMAYFRTIKAQFEAAVAAGEPVYPVTATYPEPVEHCEVCRWAVDCVRQRRRDDDLSLVAGISAKQRRALKERGVRTRAGLAGLPLPVTPPLDGVSREALKRVHDQARLQVEGDAVGKALYELIPPERDDEGVLVPDRGFLVLPPPSPNDLFFDIEGDPFALEDGVEYLFGVLEPAMTDPERPNAPRFHEIWSRDDAGEVTFPAEKAAFERLVDLLIDRLDRDPTMHVYHYAAYEKTALAKLAQRHATREEEVDRLLRARVLVDLFRVVRQAIRASVESYSIKKLEPLYELHREVELRSASSSILAFEAWLEGQTAENGEVGEAILRSIAGYNRDDVLSNWHLRDWLEERRNELEAQLGEALPRPSPEPEAEAARTPSPRQEQVATLVARLADGLPEAGSRSPEEDARWLLAQLLEWHRREDKAFWWRFYELAGMTDEQLVEEREPVGMLEFVSDDGPASSHGARFETYRFPLQDHGLKAGKEVINPQTVKEEGARTCGTIERLDEVALTVQLKRTKGQLELGRPTALIPFAFIRSEPMQDSLVRAAERTLAGRGIAAAGPTRAIADLLMRRRPRLVGGSSGVLRRDGETSLQAAIRLGLDLDGTTLAIQGPPGSGKTFTAAAMIVALVRAGFRVGVTATSHKVISNALDKVRERAEKKSVAVRIGQRAGEDDEVAPGAIHYDSNSKADAALAARDVDVVGGTSWMWSRAEAESSVDVLCVDEAGQFSVANAVAVAPAARSLVLLGDPQQLAQPLQGSHPPGAEQSALGHVLAGDRVIRADLGLFLTDTWRLHPDIQTFTSEVFYERRLEGRPELEGQLVVGRPPAGGTGVRWLEVTHPGDATESIEEADAIVGIVDDLIRSGATWTNQEGAVQPIRLGDILVVAPYNAHVERISQALAQAGHPNGRVGTVDKFQGQEAPISIYAMATSSPEEAPRGMEFLYSPNRLNVATSRARCVAIVMASPELIRVQSRTPRQIQLANALCRFVEIAAEQAAEATRSAPTSQPDPPQNPIQLTLLG
ncbi:MAG TPA: TM0106 family RecB-like putative nuclease [Candidatus Limnocylindrales bacterium]|nr:TM0106 family RecB-like putative nuclease [Candidatus Limnocylindrales bacterium]